MCWKCLFNYVVDAKWEDIQESFEQMQSTTTSPTVPSGLPLQVMMPLRKSILLDWDSVFYYICVFIEYIP